MKILIVILTALSVIGCSQENSIESSEPATTDGTISLTAKQIEQVGIKFEKIQSQKLTTSVNVSGFVDVPPNQRVKMYSMLSGRIDEIRSLVGSKVRSGQVIVTIKSPEYLQLQYNYIEAKNRLTFLKEEYERNKLLAEDNITPKKDLIRMESEYISGKAKFESIRQTLQTVGCNFTNLNEGNLSDKILIRSPINGEITSVEAVLGMQVSKANLLFEIVNTEHVHLELRVFEDDIERIAIGQKITFLPNHAEEMIEGEVYLISNVIDDKERFFRVHGHIENDQLKIGTYINATIITNELETLAVKEPAIQKAEGKHWIYLLKSMDNDSYQIKPMEVKLGVTTNGWVEVLNITQDQEYVSEGAYYLSSIK